MVSSVLNTPTAIQVLSRVVDAFVGMRQVLEGHGEVARRLEELEKKTGTHDAHFKAVFVALRKLLAPGSPPKTTRRIGFLPPPKGKK